MDTEVIARFVRSDNTELIVDETDWGLTAIDGAGRLPNMNCLPKRTGLETEIPSQENGWPHEIWSSRPPS